MIIINPKGNISKTSYPKLSSICMMKVPFQKVILIQYNKFNHRVEKNIMHAAISKIQPHKIWWKNVSIHITICMVLWQVWGMDRANDTLLNTEQVPVVPAMMSGTRASSMLSTKGTGAGWGSESSESAPAEEDDAPASSPTVTSSMMSKEPGDSSSPNRTTKFTLNYTHLQ